MAKFIEGYVDRHVVGRMRPGDKGFIDSYKLLVDEHDEVWLPFYETYGGFSHPEYGGQASLEMTLDGLVVTMHTRETDFVAQPIHSEVRRNGVVAVDEIREDINHTEEEF